MENTFDYLIGKSITGLEVKSDYEQYLLINDGSKLQITCAEYVDCCGYNDIEVTIPDGFDFNDNVITKIDFEEDEEGWGECGSVKLGIFANDKNITVEGSYGSGSGWGYGQFVEIEVIKPSKENGE